MSILNNVKNKAITAYAVRCEAKMYVPAISRATALYYTSISFHIIDFEFHIEFSFIVNLLVVIT